jgi:glycosyltransferase involved in cell wall biosynthesis
MPTNDAPEISVVIPVANEAAALPDCLARISRRLSEILVVDAASDDQSAALARAAGCHVVPAPQRHRARQMNLGAAQARGRILLFLHADTW